jgi:hypothetical protein
MKDGRVTAAPPPEPVPFEADIVDLARQMLAIRRRRDRTFPPGLFAEPAWDMLLDLVVAEAEGRRLTVSSTCIAAAVPQTTALRWLNYLAESGLVQRVQNSGESRATLVRLTPKARRLMTRTLSRN